MTFILTGQFQDGAFRVFSFESTPREASAGKYWVKADLDLALKHKIPLQDLPMLCRTVLEHRADPNAGHTLTYTGAEMLSHLRARESDEQSRRARKAPPKRLAAAQ